MWQKSSNFAPLMKKLLPILFLALVGCQQHNPAEDPISYGEDLVWQHGDSALYLCRHEWRGMVLGEQDPAHTIAHLPWHVPSKEDGQLLHMFSLIEPSPERYLCQDKDGVYWSFLFGSGKVTKAGQKTKYTLRPVRWQVGVQDTIISL